MADETHNYRPCAPGYVPSHSGADLEAEGHAWGPAEPLGADASTRTCLCCGTRRVAGDG